MSSLRNAIPSRAHKERSQPSARKKFGLLEKHKDYVQRAKAFHKKEDTLRVTLSAPNSHSLHLNYFVIFIVLQKLREKAANRNEDEFYFKMVRTKIVDGVHIPESEANKYTQEELMLMKTQDMGYILQKVQSERKKIERLAAPLHSIDNPPANKHVFFAEDREEAKELQSRYSKSEIPLTIDNILTGNKRKTDRSYKELEARKDRLSQLEKIYMDMAMKKELQKNGRKRKLTEDEIVCPTSQPVYKWRAERKR